MKILYIEPYYAGSHQQWIEAYKYHSRHQIDILSLPGKKWKWRMHGGAVSLANKFIENDKKYDLIVVSDFLNLPVFKTLCFDKLGDTKICMYFHENQITYPWSPKDQDIKLNRDLHYAYINYTSSLVSDYNFFNSNYHLTSYIVGLKKYLKKMPDFNNLDSINVISDKSSVLPLGCDLGKINSHKNENDVPIILWNHRWEYDKNPDLFFKALYKIKQKNIDFKLVVVGEHFKEFPKIFNEAKVKLKKNLLQFGFCKSFNEYQNWLNKSDILPVTSIQDFFGVSITEAIYAGLLPVLPNRLSYPELINIKNNKSIFYNTDKEFIDLLMYNIIHYKDLRKYTNKYKDLIYRFDWSNIKNVYDDKFEEISNN
tara:strand:+ start:44 stop:1150 length:1107 start_codon:yes stop_codon:yes gene_type:complete